MHWVGCTSHAAPSRQRLPDYDRAAPAQLVANTAAAARRNGALLAQVSKATHGHDLRSPDPWVFGFTFAGGALQYGPLAYHPTQWAMQVAANTVQAVLDIPR